MQKFDSKVSARRLLITHAKENYDFARSPNPFVAFRNRHVGRGRLDRDTRFRIINFYARFASCLIIEAKV